MNTAIIIVAHIVIGDDGNDYAARLCAEHERSGYGDWYLPSRKELDLMYNNLHQSGIGNFESDVFWTSEENNSGQAWFQNFGGGNQG
jgi:hypothetical protein